MDELKFAVIGNPVSHSLSPDIHLFFASQFQLERYTYNKIKSNENDFERDINDFFNNGGINNCHIFSVPKQFGYIVEQ